MIDSSVIEKVPIDHGKEIFVHFRYCSNMRTFPAGFHALWKIYFGESPINEIVPVVGTRNVTNLQRRLVRNRPGHGQLTVPFDVDGSKVCFKLDSRFNFIT